MANSDSEIARLIASARNQFSDSSFIDWQRSLQKLKDAGYGYSVVLSYAQYSPTVAKNINTGAAIDLAALVSLTAIRVNRVVAAQISKAAVSASELLKSVSDYQLWIETIEELITRTPAGVQSTLERTETILKTLQVRQFRSWAYTGIRLTEENQALQSQYFSFQNAQAEKWLRHEAGDVVFSDLQRELKLYLISLWNLRSPVREQKNNASPLTSRRISVANGVIQVPEIFPGFHGQAANNLFHAGLAHVGAHLAFSKVKFERRELKPIQIALIGLLEDARVETLAMQSFPGLRNLWAPFHTARPIKQNLVPVLLARLSRALIDPDYQDDNDWIIKARRLFFDPDYDLHDSSMCRRIGVLLGNDLGQLRAQFNAKAYVIEPAYRDDNLALWDNNEPPAQDDEEESLEVEAVRPETSFEQSSPREEDADRESNDVDNSTPVHAHDRIDWQPDAGGAVFRYTEYDYVTATERPNWTRVVESHSQTGDSNEVEELVERNRDLLNRMTSLIQSANVSTPTRLIRQNIGDALDIDACINTVIDRKLGKTPDSSIYIRTERRQRDLAVLVLLDVSNSTNDRVKSSTTTVLELELQATLLLAYAMAELGDPFAIAAFCSDGRNDVHYYRLKDFAQSFDQTAKARLAGVQGQLSTRLGAAMRHATQQLSGQRTQRKLLLVVTDGEPSDIDVKDRNYLVEDARKAVWSATRAGIDTFCVGLDVEGENNLSRIFGKRNVAFIDNLHRLPERLPMLYLRLTR